MTAPLEPHRVRTYLQRIGYGGELRPSYATLEALHLAHASHIPFENIDILLGRPIRLDLESLHAKLVTARRGGYCYEHNLLFSSVLRTLGFSVLELAARVRYRAQRVLPRTHMLLLVELEGARWLADVGFGGEGLLLPVPFGSGQAVRQFAWTYRIVEQPGMWMLQSLRDGAWLDLYAFTLEPQQLADYEMASYYMSTHPDSRFTQTLTAQLPTPGVRNILRDRELIADRGDLVSTSTIADDDTLLAVLAETFGLSLAPGTRLLPPVARSTGTPAQADR
jgi:N-hydroxyarylamine O-acetyltransferase